jgi:hypothetical protein
LNQHNQSRRDEHGRKQRGAGVGVGVERRGDPLPLRASTPSGFAELRLGLPCLKRCQRARIISATRNRNQRPQRPLFHESVRSRQGAGHRTEKVPRAPQRTHFLLHLLSFRCLLFPNQVRKTISIELRNDCVHPRTGKSNIQLTTCGRSKKTGRKFVILPADARNSEPGRGGGAVICDLPTENEFMALGRSSKARCVDSQLPTNHRREPGWH